jgi:transposase-like protein
MTADLQNPAFTDDDAARQALEALRWPDGPNCPHCGCAEPSQVSLGQGKAHREGLYYCAACNGQFTVTRTGRLTKPTTVKQKATRFLAWKRKQRRAQGK